MPRRWSGECSATYTAAPPYSPPRASPCNKRRLISRIGAAIPMREYPGSNPTVRVASPIRNMDIRKVYLRPTKSPRRPKNAAPTGRTTNPTANAIRANMNPVASSMPEKNCFEIVAAREPYRKKSYHSKTVPSDAAKSSFGSTVRIGGNASAVTNGKERVAIVHSSIPMREQKLTAAALSKLESPRLVLRAPHNTLTPDRQQLVFPGAPATGRLTAKPAVKSRPNPQLRGREVGS